MDDLKYLVALSHFPKFGPVRIKKLKKYFPGWENAFKAGLSDLINAGLEGNLAAEFISARINIDPNKIIEQLEKERIRILDLDNSDYPRLLTQIFNPPPLLYYKGEFNKQDEFSIAIVGTRKYTAYGKQVTEQLVKDLSRNNLTVVSGLALGIDTLAHLTAVQNNGRTIAVLGSGLDRQSVYPSQNRYLAEKIISNNGVVLSEFPINTPPLKHHFPQRNRLISGLSLGVVVIEAGDKSGALITADHALEQNREIFAVPGTIYSPCSIGCNKLIKLGAKPVTQSQDIIEALNLIQVTTFISNKTVIPETAEEEKILAVLNHEPLHVDELVRLTKLDTSAINSTLTIMEMKGLVKNLGGTQYVLAR